MARGTVRAQRDALSGKTSFGKTNGETTNEVSGFSAALWTSAGGPSETPAIGARQQSVSGAVGPTKPRRHLYC